MSMVCGEPGVFRRMHPSSIAPAPFSFKEQAVLQLPYAIHVLHLQLHNFCYGQFCARLRRYPVTVILTQFLDQQRLAPFLT